MNQKRPTITTRRRFLQALAAAGAIGAGGGVLAGCSFGADSEAAPFKPGSRASGDGQNQADLGPVGQRLPGAVDGRVLVIVDLQGGNDGLSTLVPAGDPRYYDYRPTLAVPDDEVLGLDDDVGLHPSLKRLHARGITTVEGVGPVKGDLSHFAMTERWERGDVSGSNSLRSGFLGRLADALDDGSPLVGLSLMGPTPHLVNQQAATMALSSPNDLWFLEPSDWTETIAFQAGWEQFNGLGDGKADDLSAMVVESYGDLGQLAVNLGSTSDEEIDWDLPMISEGGQLGQDLHFAADAIAADIGVRVIYAGNGSYDTHSNHMYTQADNLAEVDAAVDGFLARADELGFADRVLVASISEFGRRATENDTGLDHGSASTMLLAGPVPNRRLGERPALDELDDEDNLRVTVGFDQYLAGLAEEWMGVEASSILPDEPTPLALF